MTDTPARTPLYQWHAAHGGRMVDFAGWSMPVQYTSIVAEHLATRTAAGLFDVSHMGRLRFDGPDAAELLDQVVTRNVARLLPGQVRYALITNEQGGILDDVLVSRLADAAGGSYYLLVVNAGNREKIVRWIEERQPRGLNASFLDVTRDWAMIAVQGPLALTLAQPLVEAELPALKYYTAVETRIQGHGGIVSRTGYTGEDGVELIVGSEAVEQLWQALLDAGESRGVLPAGLGCRDTLRLEAAMPLYGHELNESVNPYRAGLGFAVDLKKPSLTGREALLRFSQDAAQPRRVGLKVSGKRIAREGCAVLTGDERVGETTSGTFSPTLEESIAMAYVRPESSAAGTTLQVDIRGRAEPATVVELPFYRRPGA